MKDIIRLENVSKVYTLGGNKFLALDNISFSIKRNDFIAIMGPSGSGKSTMLHILGLLDKPTKGDVYIDEIKTTRLSDDEIAEIRNRKIGFIFQQFNLMPHLISIDNVCLPCLFKEIPNHEKGKALELLELVGLKGKENNRPGQLSGGEQQRVAIARALINDPDVILADEPTGNLDSKTGKQIMDTLVHLHKDHGKTIIVVTHDPEIASYAKRHINIKDGHIIHDHTKSLRYLWKEAKK
jgi:putative ABC transport system ATP-binding protein